VAALVVGGFFSVRSARDRQANEDLTRALGEFRAGHYSDAATQLRDVASRWQSTPSGRIADLYAANADLNANNVESASVLLEGVLQGRNWPPYLQQQAVFDLAFALERKGDLPAAAARYAEANDIDGPYTALAILGEARCREQAGEKDKARELYERFRREFPEAAETEVVSAKLGELS
jgi:outer membrane protein assembly factor BamD (BamD/ComL family)